MRKRYCISYYQYSNQVNHYTCIKINSVGSIPNFIHFVDNEKCVCHYINIRTESWGNENSYQMSTCASQKKYGNYANNVEKCCLPKGTYNLDCKCSYGDGWHGGYLKIAGKKYCEDFKSGTSKKVSVTWN